MALRSYSATINADGSPALGKLGDPTGALAIAVTDAATAHTAATTADTDAATDVTNTTTADTDVGTVQTDEATVLSDIDTFAAAIIAITGDTYVAHQFVFGGATGLNHAQVATNFALLNTAITALLAAQTASAAAKTATAAAKTSAAATKTATATVVTDTATVQTDLTVATGDVTADVAVSFNPATVSNKNNFRGALRAIQTAVEGSNHLTGT